MQRVCGRLKKHITTPDQIAIYHHNALLGLVRRAILAMGEVCDASTTTNEQRQLADHIEGELQRLYRLLPERRDKGAK